MTSISLMPQEVAMLSKPLLVLEGALDGVRQALRDDDAKLALAYLEVTDRAIARLNEIHELMAEAVPIG